MAEIRGEDCVLTRGGLTDAQNATMVEVRSKACSEKSAEAIVAASYNAVKGRTKRDGSK
jgi:hypothetical protein